MTNTEVGWGILGAGMISTYALAPAITAADGARVAAVAARDRDRAAALAPAANPYGGYDDLLGDPAVEVVYIALPNDAHVPWAIEALRAGKHVLCEKPLGTDAAEVATAYQEAARAGLLLVEASWYRWHPRTRRAEDLVAGGRVGDVREVRAGFTFTGIADDNYRMDPARGGGALYDVGCYALSAVGWATRWQDPVVESVEHRRAPTGVDTMISATMRAGGARAEIRAAFDEPDGQWIEVVGTESSMRFGPPAFTAWGPDGVDLLVGDEVIPFTPCNPYRLMVEAVSTVLSGGEAWILPPAEAMATARTIDALRTAAGSCRPR